MGGFSFPTNVCYWAPQQNLLTFQDFKCFRPTVRFPKPRRGSFPHTTCSTFPRHANLSLTEGFQWVFKVSVGSRRVSFGHIGTFLFWTSREPSFYHGFDGFRANRNISGGRVFILATRTFVLPRFSRFSGTFWAAFLFWQIQCHWPSNACPGHVICYISAMKGVSHS